VIATAARGLLTAAAPLIERRGITLVGVAVANLDNESNRQLTLPYERGEAGRLDSALDAVADRFGRAAITRAVLLGRDHGEAVPLLPD
jgi:DNA polymerase IV